MWNPWQTRCPECKALLEMALPSKLAAVLSVPAGLLFGGIPIYMEETGHWATVGSLTYFVVGGALLSYLGRILWPKTQLLLKSGSHK